MRALLFLLQRRLRGRLRRIGRRMRGWRGGCLTGGVILLLVMVLGPQLLMLFGGVDQPATPSSIIELTRQLGPLFILVFAFFSISAGGLHFSPAEVQFLFPAPFSRRQLLLYNVLSRVWVQVLSGLWISIFVVRLAASWLNAVIASVLLMVFLQLMAQASGLMLAAAGEKVARTVRRFVALGAIAAVGGAVVWVRSVLPEGGSWLDWSLAIADLPAVRAISAVARPFIEIFLADNAKSTLGWTVVALGIVGAELGLMMAFDVAYSEGALAHSQRIQRRLERARTGGVLAMHEASRGKRLPPFPRVAGAGPLAWRGVQEMVRNPRGVFTAGFTVVAMPLMMLWLISDRRPDGMIALPLGFLFLFPLINQHLAFGFHRDLDRIGLLKSLPLSATAIAAGQLASTVLLFTFWQAIGLVTIAVLSGGQLSASDALLLAGLAVPLNWLAISMDNALFLTFPYRIAVADPGQVTFFGRVMLMLIAKLVVIMLAIGLSLLPALIVFIFTSSLVLVAVVAILTLALASVLTTLLLAYAFYRFDVSTDMPE